MWVVRLTTACIFLSFSSAVFCVFWETIEKLRWSTEDLFPVPVSCVFCHLLDIWESMGTLFFFFWLILSVRASATQSYKATTPCFYPSVIYCSLSMHKGSCGRPEPIPAVTGRRRGTPRRHVVWAVSSGCEPFMFCQLYLLFKWSDQLQVDEGAWMYLSINSDFPAMWLKYLHVFGSTHIWWLCPENPHCRLRGRG